MIPIELVFYGAVQGWNIEAKVNSTEGVYIDLAVTFTRSSTTKFFSIAITIILWCLSLTVLTVAVGVWVRGKKLELPTIAIAGALLFALPAIRNTQPGIPPIGCNLDAAGFFWNMALIAVSVLLLLWNYIITYIQEYKADEKAQVESATKAEPKRVPGPGTGAISDSPTKDVVADTLIETKKE